MRLTALADDKDGKCPSEHGLSILAELSDGRKILLDSGESGLFLDNAKDLGLDLGNVFVLSHGHYDHGNGFQFLEKGGLLYCHPDAFLRRYRKKDGSYIGIESSENLLERRGLEIVKSKEPLEISKGVWFLGEIPRRTDFESVGNLWKLQDGRDDQLKDDSGIAIWTEKGLIVLSGCGHSGICNAVLRAIEVSGTDRVFAVGGGFHLKDGGETAEKTAKFLKRLGVSLVILSHCTCADAKGRFIDEGLEVRALPSGDSVNL